MFDFCILVLPEYTEFLANSKPLKFFHLWSGNSKGEYYKSQKNKSVFGSSLILTFSISYSSSEDSIKKDR